MKHILILTSLAVVLAARAITLDNVPDPESHLRPPPASYEFPGWSECGQLIAGQTVFTNGLVARDSAFVAWPIGPNSFASTLHVTDWWLAPELRCDRIRFLGTDYPITNSCYLGNDMALHQVSKPIPYWHSVWDGSMAQTNVSCIAFPGFDLCSTNIGNRIPTNAEFMMVGIGVFGNRPCGDYTSPSLVPAWQFFTNGILADSRHLVEMEELHMDRLASAWATNGTWLNAHLTYGGTIGIQFTVPGLTSSFGGRGGDSGGALFIREQTQAKGRWQLVGFLRGSGHCEGSISEVTVLSRAPGFRGDYWALIGEPDRSSLRTNIGIASYPPCTGSSPAPTPAPTPVPATPQAPASTNVTRPVNLGPSRWAVEQTADDLEELAKKLRRLISGQ